MAGMSFPRPLLSVLLVSIGCAAGPPPAASPSTVAIAQPPPPVPSAASTTEPLHAPTGYIEMKVLGLGPGPNDGAAVLLTDEKKTVVIPIFVGGTEAVSIALRLDHHPHPRPLTHDLLESLLKELGGELVKVQIDELSNETFLGS